MSVNYGALRGEPAGASAFPEDGLHAARLQGAEIIPVDNGARSRLKTSWVELQHGLLFDVWFELSDANRRAGNRRAIDETIDLLDGLGIDRDTLSSQHPLDIALTEVIGRDYQVSTQRWTSQAGNNGVNLTVEDKIGVTVGAAAPATSSSPPDYRPAPTQQPLTSPQNTDVPVDESEMSTPPSRFFGDDDIPF